ncbi:MAG TPA: hypothetical protein VMA35_03790 [Candidatus Sulfopaludibacter sp.]|nr:hypothetical protein [Candidatus Sulfopaludibacter sp.]
MNAGPLMVLCAALAASGISIRAEDTADQAAARAALEQKLYQLDHAEAPPPDTNSAAGMAQPPESFTNVTNAVSATAVPVTKVSAAVAPAKAAPPSTAPADGNFAQKIPAADASAQAAALAALNQKMNELNTPAASPPPVANSATTTAVTPMVAPAHEPSASATPVTEAPTAEAPVAVAPAMAPAAMAPVSTAPAVLAPAPRVSPAAVAASVAVVPVATPAPVTLPAGTPPAAAPATPRLPSSSPRQMRPTNELVTMAGVIYKNVEVQKVMADAVVISYTPAHGDWAMAKVYFRDLLPEIRRQYEKP